jgi:hypothetical protein
MDIKDNHHALSVAMGRHTKFDDLDAVKAVDTVATIVLKDPRHYGSDTLWLAAQCITIPALSEPTSSVINAVAKGCGLCHVCCTNKVLRAKGADHAQVAPTPTCKKGECNLHPNHIVPSVDMSRGDYGYTIPDDYLPVADR